MTTSHSTSSHFSTTQQPTPDQCTSRRQLSARQLTSPRISTSLHFIAFLGAITPQHQCTPQRHFNSSPSTSRLHRSAQQLASFLDFTTSRSISRFHINSAHSIPMPITPRMHNTALHFSASLQYNPIHISIPAHLGSRFTAIHFTPSRFTTRMHRSTHHAIPRVHYTPSHSSTPPQTMSILDVTSPNSISHLHCHLTPSHGATTYQTITWRQCSPHQHNAHSAAQYMTNRSSASCRTMSRAPLHRSPLRFTIHSTADQYISRLHNSTRHPSTTFVQCDTIDPPPLLCRRI